MISEYDLHCHSTASDGALTPSGLVEAAYKAGVKTLALTDHDTTGGVAEAEAAAAQYGIELVRAIELSLTWSGQCFHVVGLNIDPANAALRQGLQKTEAIRVERAKEMARKLGERGIEGAFEGARRIAGDGTITRTHFARYVVSQGRCSTLQEVFDRYLSRGKPAYVPTVWATLEEGIGWIRSAGGIGVLAHPMRHKLSASWMRRLLVAFKEAGGAGLEVVSGRGAPDAIQASAAYARSFGLMGSVGSDFHSAEHPWAALGRLDPLPKGITPVWSAWVDFLERRPGLNLMNTVGFSVTGD